MKLISIIAPCYNEQEAIGLFYQKLNEILETIKDYYFELIFVNDGSKDQTLERIKALREKDNRIGIVDFSRNFGKEAALLAGLRMAKGDAVIVMDVDLQDPPELILQMIDNWEAGYDIVYTRRVSRKGEPPIRSFFAKLFYRVINRMSEVEIVDGARDYRIMSRQVVESLLSLKEKNRFSKGLFVWVGYKSKLIEFEHASRVAGNTKWSFVKLFSYALEGIISFSNVPLKFASIMGMLISVPAFLFMLYIIIKTMIFNNPVDGWASIVTIVLFLGGIQLLVLGIIGEYIGKIFIEIKDRPVYLIRECQSSQFGIASEEQKQQGKVS